MTASHAQTAQGQAMTSPVSEPNAISADTATADNEGVQAVNAVAATPVHPMPDQFPEVDLDDGTGNIRIKAPVVTPAVTANAATTVSDPAPTSPATVQPIPETTQATPVAIVPAIVPTAPVAVISTPIAAAPDYNLNPTYQPERNVCVRCGSTNLAKGYVVDYAEKFRHIHFAPKRMTPRRLNSIMAMRPFRSIVQLDAQACRDCGAVLLIVDPSELRRTERRRSD